MSDDNVQFNEDGSLTVRGIHIPKDADYSKTETYEWSETNEDGREAAFRLCLDVEVSSYVEDESS